MYRVQTDTEMIVYVFGVDSLKSKNGFHDVISELTGIFIYKYFITVPNSSEKVAITKFLIMSFYSTDFLQLRHIYNHCKIDSKF
ncbi:CLUMA_CG013672, isoform A [Clunio marinus]|uniref:CLUMA_CG013672, isoform A n=1 Tax=Clunio marinus TaxID=568069 RepID=A0A1J1IJI5_9DIPT|nr:CLUMA_CG013672, isoform A [Clunio marinus]